jgi:Right handed beta helix region
MLVLLAATGAAHARVLQVGPHRALRMPSQAALVARDGDTVTIDTGTYRDCAVWRASGLTIEGRGPHVEIADTVCGDRALFVVLGSHVTIRGIAFTGAHGMGHNAAGILDEGDGLTVENARFENNENGILVGGSAASVVRIRNSVFVGNGSCVGACSHGVYAGAAIALLDIEYCRFLGTKVAHHIKSRARETIVAHNEILDGDDGTSSYLIDVPNGGTVTIVGNTLQKGRHSGNPEVAIAIGEEAGRNPTSGLEVRDNRFTSDLPEPTIFVRNRTGVPAALAGNVLVGKVVPLEGPGTVAPAQ